MKPFEVDVSSRFGAPMGRHSDEIPAGVKVHLQRVPMVDGDYDPGGAYWGGPSPTTGAIYCAWSDSGLVRYFRAHSREDAKAKLPGCKFFR